MAIMGEKNKSNIDEIFDRVLDAQTKIFSNREVLTPNHVPDILPHRDDKFEELVKILAPSLTLCINSAKVSSLIVLVIFILTFYEFFKF